MKEIKFRIWNDRLKKLGEPFSLEDFLKCSVGLLHESRYSDPIIYMQYTGLKDSKGVEIYEGDILSYLEAPLYWEVIWHNNLCCFRLENTRYCEEAHLYGGTPEVVGNIYENPELLKEPVKQC